ncbi:ankyrin repeat-containing domain protein [Triangularia verruculosa]|uniref:Ankyrin repeat-containing domain protein n=1 Tax=Triangularia verruculosa TaxID=2587418 RepID=A0AAN6X890_9PEZI|nr:ankyrin repeat-containing domain protein [Triangularia verruculosa]
MVTMPRESHGLHVDWPIQQAQVATSVPEEKADVDSPVTPEYDYIVVPGIFGTWDDANRSSTNPGSGTSRWLSTLTDRYSESRLLHFQYEPRKLFAGRRSREAIRNCALNLLRGLVELSADRSMMLIAHDMGCIIVKEALIMAITNPDSWPGIAESSHAFVFLGCPHRSADVTDMEDRLSFFVFSEYDWGTTMVRPSATTIAPLAAAVVEINSQFVLSKVPLRIRLISIHGCKGRPRSKSDLRITEVFDEFCGTLGVSFERTIKEPSSDTDLGYHGLVEYIYQIHKQVINRNFGNRGSEIERRLFQSLAFPFPPPRSAYIPDSEVTNTPEYITWASAKGSHILYLHGPHDIRPTTEQVFHTLNRDTSKYAAPPLYFSFNRFDFRRQTMGDLASAVLAQLICLYPTSVGSRFVQDITTRLSHERSWTEKDSMYWLALAWTIGNAEPVTLMINNFEDCDKGSRATFLKMFSSFARSSEQSKKVVITSSKTGTLLTELMESDCPHTVYQIPSTQEQAIIDAILTQNPHLEALSIQEKILSQWQGTANLDPLVRHIIFAQARVHDGWPDKISLEELFGPFDELSPEETGNNDPIVKILEIVLKRVPDQPFLDCVLTWTLYSHRPLTVAELSTAMNYHPQQVSAPLEIVEETKQKIGIQLAGIIEVHDNEVQLAHPRLRDVLVDMGDKGPWAHLRGAAHETIARTCLDYLCLPKVQEIVESEVCRLGETATYLPMEGNLCHYALRAWVHHLVQVPDNSTRRALTEKLGFEKIGRNLALGHWTLSNQLTRSTSPLTTLYPVLAGYGVLNVVEPLGKNDAKLGLLEAARHGQRCVIREILQEFDFSQGVLFEALVAAGASGDEDLLIELVDYTLSKAPNHQDISWPAGVMHRASWLGLDRFLEKMLNLGFPVESELQLPNSSKTMSLLYQAVMSSQVNAAKTLLKHCADIEYRSSRDKSVLHCAAVSVYPATVKTLLHTAKPSIDIKDSNDRTPLYHACLWGQHEVVDTLLQKGADPNMGSPEGKWCPLTLAVDDGFKTCVELLLAKGADPNTFSASGTALRYAAVRGHTQICHLLLDAGARPNNPKDEVPILIQVIQAFIEKNDLLDILALLVERGATVNAQTSTGMSALMQGARQVNGVDILKLLLRHGANLELEDKDEHTSLYYALRGNNPATVRLLLEHGANPDHINNSQKCYILPPFVHRPDLLRILLEHGADPNLPTPTGFPPLMYAAGLMQDVSLELLLEHGVAVDAMDETVRGEWYGFTAVAMAVTFGTADAVRILAEHGADLKWKGTAKGEPLLIQASRRTSVPETPHVLTALLEFPARIDMNVKSSYGLAAIHHVRLDPAVYRRVVNASADVNLRTDNDGFTPLLLAAQRGQLENATHLLKRNADVNLAHESWGSPLTQACCEAQVQITKLLVQHKADVNYCVPQGVRGSILSAACLAYKASGPDSNSDRVQEIIQFLLENGADVNIAGGFFRYPILTAAYKTVPDTINLLLRAGANVNAKDGMGRSPIHMAACRGGIDNVEAILQAGGDVAAKDGHNRTVLHWAAAAGRASVAKMLLSRDEVAVDAPDIDGWTPLCWAARGAEYWIDKQSPARERPDHFEVISLLLRHGADRSIVVHLDDKRWTPLKIARFSRIEQSNIIELLRNGIAESPGPVLDGDEHESEKAFQRTIRVVCDFCQGDICGLAYQCQACYGFYFCFKCYAHRHFIHAPDHNFLKLGPEFEEKPERKQTQDGKVASDTDTSETSADESEDDSEE